MGIKKEPRVCKTCGELFVPNYKFKAFCSEECKNVGRENGPAPAKCKLCGEDILGKGVGGGFCTPECHRLYSNRERQKTNERHIDDTLKKAKELGISYGQLKAMEYMQAHKYDKF